MMKGPARFVMNLLVWGIAGFVVGVGGAGAACAVLDTLDKVLRFIGAKP